MTDLTSDKLVQTFLSAPLVSFDTEFENSPTPRYARWTGFSMACRVADGPEGLLVRYWPFKGHEAVDPKWAINTLIAPILGNPERRVAMHYCKVDVGIVASRNIPVRCQLEDTGIKAFLWDENLLRGLKPQAKEVLGFGDALTYSQTQKELKQYDKKAAQAIKDVCKAAWEHYAENRRTSSEESPPDLEIMDDWPSWKRVVHRLPPKMPKTDVVDYIHGRFSQKINEFYQREKDKRFAKYGGDDAKYTLLLEEFYSQKFVEFKAETGCDLQLIHDELELPIMKIVVEMEYNGVSIDLPCVQRIRKGLIEIKASLEAQFAKWFGTDFNPRAAAQVAHLFWNVLKLKPPAWHKPSKKTGAFGVSDDVLTYFAEKQNVGVAKALKRLRGVNILLSTFAEGIIGAEKNGRIHTSFNPVGADTGRFSSSDPINMQNIPKPAKMPQLWAPDGWKPEPEDKPKNLPEGRVYAGVDKKTGQYKWRLESFRKCFVPSPGFKLISYDLSQIELRLAAHFSKDKELIEAYTRWDCAECKSTGHTTVALHKCPKCGAGAGKRDKLNPEQPPIKGFCLGQDIHAKTCVLTPLFKTYGMERGRDLAKPVNFGLLYMKQYKSLALELDVTEPEAKVIYDGYFNAYPGLRRFHQWIEQRLLNVGWFEMLSGRRRRFMADVRLFKMGKMPEWQFRSVLRTASNCIIQGSAADVMKLGMITFWRKIRANPKYAGVRIMLQVHDEILLEAPEAIAEEVSAILQESLETCCSLRVPILSEGSVGRTTWEDAH